MTLVELIAAIFLVAAAITWIVGDVAVAQKTTAVTQNAANLQAEIRYVSDYLRDHAKTAYQPCAPSGYTVPNPPSPLPPLSPANPITQLLYNASSTTRTVNGVTSAIPPLKDCGTGQLHPASCTSGRCDWGVQQITIQQQSHGVTLTRTVWKAAP